MLLLTGPPGSGKTHFVLDKVRDSARSGADRVRLLTPTATMAEHLLNQVAREGLLPRPNSILTLWHFIEPLAGEPPEVPEATFRFLVQEALEAASPAEFDRVVALPGFQRALGELIRELSVAGSSPEDLAAAANAEFGEAVAEVFRRVDTAVRARGLAMRNERLHRAAGRIDKDGLAGVDSVLFDGFFTFTEVELDLIRALSNHVDVTVTLPVWEGAERARQALLRLGLDERRVERVRATPEHIVFTASTLDQEAEEIARRILEQAAAGRLFREIGVVVRAPSPYVPVLRNTLERFGIPARFYFAEPLALHPAVRRIAGVVDAMLGGWDHEETLGALRMHPASADLDRFEFEALDQIPGQGLDALRGPDELLDPLRQLESWRELSATPEGWAAKFATFRALFPPPAVTDGVSHEQAGVWRSHAAALDAFDRAMEETAAALPQTGEVALAEFWREAKAVLEMRPLRSRDHRRNVVHVMDVHEARQWELPVVFVCGLLERAFPKHHSESPLLSDDARLRMRQQGIHLPTSRELEKEERFLFELATTRATEMLALSYPKYNAKGDENLPSFLLQHFAESADVSEEPARPVRPQPSRARSPRRRSLIHDPELRERVAERHATLSPTSIETFLQCPFRFFAERSLRLAASPAPPEQRLDVRLQGSIVHAVLAEQVRRPQRLGSLFERVFESECNRARVPPGYLTEAVRLEMLLSLRLFFAGEQPATTERVRTEEAFELTLEGGLNVRGKIDRLDVTADGKALITDYKYTRSYNLPKLVRENNEARRVQAGLYLRAVREYFEYEPAGMEFCTIRRGVDRKGWHDPEELAELVELSTSQTLNAARQIREGRIEADPADTDKCEYCDFSDICRVETAAPIAIGAPAPAVLSPAAPAPAVPSPAAPAPAVPPLPIGGDSQ